MRIQLLLLSLLIALNVSGQTVCPVPLYTDPNFRGAADPEVVWNEHEQEWWMFYTSRRAVCENAPLPALAIGVAVSKDWIEWKHKGYIKIDGVGGEPAGGDVLWAPGIVKDGSMYHMFLTFKKRSGSILVAHHKGLAVIRGCSNVMLAGTLSQFVFLAPSSSSRR